MNERPLTLGERRVRISFNPSTNPLVDEIKKCSAYLIDLMGTIDTNGDPETELTVARARLKYEEGSEAAVKAATAGK